MPTPFAKLCSLARPACARLKSPLGLAFLLLASGLLLGGIGIARSTAADSWFVWLGAAVLLLGIGLMLLASRPREFADQSSADAEFDRSTKGPDRVLVAEPAARFARSSGELVLPPGADGRRLFAAVVALMTVLLGGRRSLFVLSLVAIVIVAAAWTTLMTTIFNFQFAAVLVVLVVLAARLRFVRRAALDRVRAWLPPATAARAWSVVAVVGLSLAVIGSGQFLPTIGWSSFESTSLRAEPGSAAAASDAGQAATAVGPTQINHRSLGERIMENLSTHVATPAASRPIGLLGSANDLSLGLLVLFVIAVVARNYGVAGLADKAKGELKHLGSSPRGLAAVLLLALSAIVLIGQRAEPLGTAPAMTSEAAERERLQSAIAQAETALEKSSQSRAAEPLPALACPVIATESSAQTATDIERLKLQNDLAAARLRLAEIDARLAGTSPQADASGTPTVDLQRWNRASEPASR
jgi:hypothetical protein